MAEPAVRFPNFSIVIPTDGRAAALRNTLECLRFIDYPCFEVCVVVGPTADGTRELLDNYTGEIKVATCPERNINMARNIGIALSTGEVLAFIDDDALAEPEWLSDLEVAFRDPAVGGAGGVVYDYTGAKPQYLYSSANRLGQCDWARQTPADDFNFPLSFNIPYLQGTNSAFRRSALLAVGGFDEEYEYYLEETDLCCRMVDAGFVIRQLPRALVHHKFLPSEIRNEHRVARRRYTVLKNKIYFSLVNNRGHYGLDEAIRDGVQFVDVHDRDIRYHLESGRLQPDDHTTFQSDVERAWKVGLRRGLSGERRLLQKETLHRHATNYLEFPRSNPCEGRRTFVYISQEYPPDRMYGGIGRFVQQLARGNAALGHHVHVLSGGESQDRVDFEDGVWVHRLCIRAAEAASPPGLTVPSHVWAHAVTMQHALEGIASKRKVTAVCAPIWNCEGIAVLADGRFPLVTSLHTTMRAWLANNPELVALSSSTKDLGEQMLAIEARIILGSNGILANSQAIIDEIEHEYGLQLDRDRVAVVPHGLEDWTNLPADRPPKLPCGALRLLFVGRLEGRKGIDVLLAAAKQVLMRYSHVYLDIAGNDTIPGPGGRPWRALFEEDPESDALRARVTFHGQVSDARLRGLYSASDVVVTPSRFESFGLTLIEGMMFGKPVVGCSAGGMVEVLQDGETGLLAQPGDVRSLEACLIRLIEDRELRARLGISARACYESRFKADQMVAKIVAFLSQIGDSWDRARSSLVATDGKS
jgi:glycosyltransferase involved in cell wall biosynthesis/GT2 family glycosyltransferase